jgi:hypothetical protein
MPNRLTDPTASFPESIEALPVPSLRPELNAWVARHNRAVHAYIRERVGAMSDLRRPERALLSLIDGIERYVSSGPEHPDGIATPAVGQMLDAVRTLLNFELGRLDGGTLDAWVHHTAERIGWDLDINDWKDDAS